MQPAADQQRTRDGGGRLLLRLFFPLIPLLPPLQFSWLLLLLAVEMESARSTIFWLKQRDNGSSSSSREQNERR